MESCVPWQDFETIIKPYYQKRYCLQCQYILTQRIPVIIEDTLF